MPADVESKHRQVIGASTKILEIVLCKLCLFTVSTVHYYNNYLPISSRIKHVDIK